MQKILGFFAEYWVRFVVSLFIGLTVYVVSNAIFNTWSLTIAHCNSCFIAGFVLVGISALAALNLFGAFDIFSFYFNRKKKENGDKEVLYDYSTRKKQERLKVKLAFLPYLLVGSLFLIASLILYFLI